MTTETQTKVPQEEAPLTAKKKRALLEYMGIMFAVAFLFVAISLGIKVNAMQDDLEAANRGARENIAAVQQMLDEETAKNQTLQSEADEAAEALSKAQAALDAASAETAEVKAALEQQQKDAAEKLAACENSLKATELLLQAQTAAAAHDSAALEKVMNELEPLAHSLSEHALKLYNELKSSVA